MRYALAVVLVLTLVGCQKGHPVWTTLSVRDAATDEPVASPLLAIRPQAEKGRGTRAAVKADDAGTARLMIEQGAVHYRVSVRAGDVTEHVDLPPLVESYDDRAWHATVPGGTFEVQLMRDADDRDPFAGLNDAD